MIFISTGTQFPFDRFIKIVDEIAGEMNEEFIVQAIPGEYEAKNLKLVPRISIDDFNRYVKESRLILSHAGMGTIISALLESKPIIVFPRRAALGEQRNDHQLATAKHLESLKYVKVAHSKQDLEEFVKGDATQQDHQIGKFATSQLIEYVDDFLGKQK